MQHYGTTFFTDLQQMSQQSANEVVPIVLEYVQPTSVIDVGCGMGIWLAAFRQYGINDILGVDGDYVDRRALQIPAKAFVPSDLEQPFNVGREFDLVVSLEVAEHLSPESAETFVQSLVSLGPVILFSAAIPFQAGTNHVNTQWQGYWANLFQNRDYVTIDCIRKRIWANDKVDWYYAQNIQLFVRRDYLEGNPALKKEFENTAAAQVSLVHPKWYTAIAESQVRLADHKNMPLRALLAALPFATLRAVQNRSRRLGYKILDKSRAYLVRTRPRSNSLHRKL